MLSVEITGLTFAIFCGAGIEPLALYVLGKYPEHNISGPLTTFYLPIYLWMDPYIVSVT